MKLAETVWQVIPFWNVSDEIENFEQRGQWKYMTHAYASSLFLTAETLKI